MANSLFGTPVLRPSRAWNDHLYRDDQTMFMGHQLRVNAR